MFYDTGEGAPVISGDEVTCVFLGTTQPQGAPWLVREMPVAPNYDSRSGVTEITWTFKLELDSVLRPWVCSSPTRGDGAHLKSCISLALLYLGLAVRTLEHLLPLPFLTGMC